MIPGGSVSTGSLLDRRYRIDAPIARGGMSTVYRALDTRLDRPVAVKIMDPKFAADPAFVARFEFEARAVARLSNPG
ncbi:MAG: serine/threonine protein kinase, partial [Rhodococcus sp. (in: high G+C Gram-positive bacteria)]